MDHFMSFVCVVNHLLLVSVLSRLVLDLEMRFFCILYKNKESELPAVIGIVFDANNDLEY